MTGHGVDGTLPDDLNLPALADPMATTVIFMGKRTFALLAQQLQAHGLPASTPALLAEEISKPDQKITRGTVAGLAQKLATDTGASAALILYGPLALKD